jgi:hypothetical protein
MAGFFHEIKADQADDQKNEKDIHQIPGDIPQVEGTAWRGFNGNRFFLLFSGFRKFGSALDANFRAFGIFGAAGRAHDHEQTS